MSRRIILFELNEVPLRVVEEYCRKKPASALARTIRRCRIYRTHTEDTGHLSPWTTWPTLHRGVTSDRHGIQEFGQSLEEVDAAYPPLWSLLAARGVSTGVFGSLHSYPPPSAGCCFHVPDVFAAGSECFPVSLGPAQEFMLDMVRRSTRNVNTGVPWRSAIRFLRAAPGLGLKPRTWLDAGIQLAAERANAARKVRRRTMQAVLAFDVFFRQLETTRPAFATFFTNHVASAMHRYWAAAFPEDYAETGFDRSWTSTYRDEIDFAMGRFDRFFARLTAFADRNPEYSLWVAGSMGQAATRALPLETQLFVTDPDRFAAALRLSKEDWSRVPTMFPQYNLRVRRERAGEVAERLRRLAIDGTPLGFRRPEENLFCLDLGQPNLYLRPEPVVVMDGRGVPAESLGLGNVEIEDKSGTTAFHIPQGMLLIYDPASADAASTRSPEISTAEIAPAVLANFGIPPPAHMSRPAEL